MTYLTKRRIVFFILTAVYLCLPFIKIGGEPLARFDIIRGEIILFGLSVSSAYIFPTLLFLLAGTFLFLYLTQLLGRIWCGWLCPQTVTLDLIPIKKSAIKRFLTLLLIVFLFSCGAVLYTMDFSLFLKMFKAGEIHTAWWIFSALMFLEYFFVGRKFCATVCPYSMFQSVTYDDDTLRVAFDKEREGECTKCAACVRVCPTGLDIRTGLSNKCVSCARCVDACAKVMKRLKKTGLVGHSFGPLDTPKPFKLTKLISLSLAAVFLLSGGISLKRVEDVKIKVENLEKIANTDIYVVTIKIKSAYKIPLYIKIAESEGVALKTIELKPKGSVSVTVETKDKLLRALISHGRHEDKRHIKVR